MFKNNFKKENLNKGFTLVEMLVAVAIFSIVVVIALGAILTILDANRKARTLTEVMNNLNFSVETMTRSLKTGVEPNSGYSNGGWFTVGSVVLSEDGFRREQKTYTLDEGKGAIMLCVKQFYNPEDYSNSYDLSDLCPDNNWQPITSDMVFIDNFEPLVVGKQDGNQPRTQLFISGTVRINEKISSDFSIQTTVSQRRLNLGGSELDSGE